MRFLIVVFSIFLVTGIVAQNEANNWFFSNQCGIDFNSGSPQFTNVSPMNTAEASSVASDANGNLLFYTDGAVVYNAQHNAMTNGTGLLGSNNLNFGNAPNAPGTSSQGAGIVPYPGNPNLYFVFTLGNGGTGGMYYSIVDMSLSGGLGAVTNIKNVLLDTNMTEKMTIVKHANCVNYWVMSMKYNTAEYHAFEVTPNGISAPVITTIGSVAQFVPTSPPPGAFDFDGQMKFSPNGKLLCHYLSFSGRLQLFDFDNSTGVLSNLRTSPASFLTNFIGSNNAVGNQIYGVEFSPNSRFVYICNNNSTTGNPVEVWQFPTNAPNFWQLGVTVHGVLPPPPQVSVFVVGQHYGMQLGPDGRIYIARAGISSMSVIDKPNLQGAACNFIYGGFNFGTNIVGLYGTLGACQGGTPLFPQNLFNQLADFTVQNQNLCETDTVQFTYNGVFNPDSILWNFGDPSSGVMNQSTSINPGHFYNAPGNYDAQLVVWQGCDVDTALFTVIVDSIPVFDLGPDSTLCEGGSVNFDFSSYSGVDFLWSDGSTAPSNTISTSGVYSLQMTSQNGCASSDTVVISVIPFVDASIAVADDSLCVNDALISVNPVSSGGVWSGTGVDTLGNFDPSTGAGTYWISYEFDGLCPSLDSIEIYVFDLPVIDFEASQLSGCEPLTVNFYDNVVQPGQLSTWFFGDGTQSNLVGGVEYTYTVPGVYSVTLQTVSSEGCINSAALLDLIEVFPNPVAQFGFSQDPSDTAVTVQFTDFSSLADEWYWDLGDGMNSVLQNPSSSYGLGENVVVTLYVATSNGCVDSLTQFFESVSNLFLYVPNSFTPNGDGVNDVFVPVLIGADVADYQLLIFNRWGEIIFETTQAGEGWSGVSSETGLSIQDGVYTWSICYKAKGSAERLKQVGHVNLLR